MAALRAGVPSSIIWHNVDQPFHARRCADLGVGPLGFPKGRLSVSRLAGLLTELTGPGAGGYQRAAATAAGRLTAERGTQAAEQALERWHCLGPR